MGIERFFNTLKYKYGKDIISDLKDKILSEYLLLDFNSIIHNISQNISDTIVNLYHIYLISLTIPTIMNIKKEKITESLKNIITNINLSIDFSKLSINDIDEKFFEIFIDTDNLDKLIISKICDYMKYLIDLLPNLKYLYLSIDGVPLYGKIIEQKRRRYIGHIISQSRDLILEKYKNELDIESKIYNNSFNEKNIYYNHYLFEKTIKNFKFNKGKISPATQFMFNLENELNSYLKNKINFLIDGYNNFGEGEKKICFKIHEIYNQTKKINKISVYSPDADVILLMLLESNKANINILRYDPQNHKLEIIDINLLRKIIIDYIKCEKLTDDIQYNIIKDIVMIFTIFGNDFLPKLNIINTNKHINKILDSYIKVFKKNNYIFGKNINWKLLLEFFINLNIVLKNEKQDKIYRNKKWKLESDQYINANAIKFYEHLFSLEYLSGIYNPDINSSNITNILVKENKYTLKYLLGFIWLNDYYLNHNTDYKLYIYNYDFVPSLENIIENIKNIMNKDIKEKLQKYYISDKKYFIPLTQLLYITPNNILSIVEKSLIKYKKLIIKYNELYNKHNNIVKLKNSKVNINNILDCKNVMYVNRCFIKNEEKINIKKLLKFLNI
jgi:5'-3' exonuclease